MLPRKLDAAKQQDFIAAYENLLNNVKVAIEGTSGRQRLNIHGAIDLETGATRMIGGLSAFDRGWSTPSRCKHSGARPQRDGFAGARLNLGIGLIPSKHTQFPPWYSSAICIGRASVVLGGAECAAAGSAAELVMFWVAWNCSPTAPHHAGILLCRSCTPCPRSFDSKFPEKWAVSQWSW
jgi:hypothetical protein